MYSIEEIVNPRVSEKSDNRSINSVHIISLLSAYRTEGQKLEVRVRVKNGSADMRNLKGQLCLKDGKGRHIKLADMVFEKKASKVINRKGLLPPNQNKKLKKPEKKRRRR